MSEKIFQLTETEVRKMLDAIGNEITGLKQRKSGLTFDQDYDYVEQAEIDGKIAAYNACYIAINNATFERAYAEAVANT